MDKKRLSVTTNADAIILRSETKCYEGRFTHEGIVVTVKERKDNRVTELLKILVHRIIPVFVYSAIICIVLNILDIKYIPYTDVPLLLLLLTIFFLLYVPVFTLCEYAIYLIVISRYSIPRKNKITAGLKLEILLNEFLINDYVCSSKKFKKKLTNVLISDKNTKMSEKTKYYSSTFQSFIPPIIVLLLSQKLVVKIFNTNAEIFDYIFLFLFYITLLFSTIFIFEELINSLMTKLELKCCTTQKLYLRYVNLATAIAQKYFETEYPEKFSKN